MNSVILWRLVFPALLCIIFFSLSGKASYPFVHHATLAPPVSSYDYIIVGGGTAGCGLAATLSEKGKVLLLERGGSPLDHPTVNFVATFGATLADNSPYSASQTFVSTDGVINARARVLGGGSALNAGFYSRASVAFVNQAGWDQRLVNESYEWVEKKVAFQPVVRQFQSAFRAGLLEAGVQPDNGFTYNHLTGTKIGGTIFDPTGRRHTAAELLEYADPTKINVYLYATVHQILFIKGGKSPRASGVEFRDKAGIIHKAILNDGPKNEVILCAGALGSPQLLMLSGIGPKEHLAAHGIDVVLDQPMVGQVMSDNPANGLVIPSPTPVEISLIQIAGITEFNSFVQAASFGSLFGWIHPHKLTDFFQTLANQTGQNSTGKFYQSLLRKPQGIGAILEKAAGPLSTGHLILKTRSPYDNPIVTFNYFKEPEDLQRCVQGMRTIIRVVESKAFSNFRHSFLPVQVYINAMLKLPNNLRRRRVSSAFNLEKYCVDTVMTIWHYHGGCLVGKVVDKGYKVIGVDGLRVIDGSAFRFSPGTNPQATFMMLGRYMGKTILNERSPDGKK